MIGHIGTELGSAGPAPDGRVHLGPWQPCLARRACPVGADYRYDVPQARFHMQAFLSAAPAAEER